MSGATPRRLYVVSQESFGPVLLGPAARQLELAAGGVEAGVETILVGRSCASAPVDPFRFLPLDDFRLDMVRPGDALVVSAYLPGRWLAALARTRIPFHADLYCITATEILPGLDALPGWKAWLQRWRRVLRYATLCARAERIYVSSSLQTSLLGGMLFALPGRTAQRLAFHLPAKACPAPMSIRAEAWKDGAANPYPAQLRGLPVFLWGGGIWKWFDVDTVLEAFAILAGEGSPARLFFLAGRNPSNHSDQDEPHRKAALKAGELGILGRTVFFNDKPVGPADLPAYLEHCRAGILANHPHLESATSWRTRQLDLLWAGRPGVVAGEDPLSDRMARGGAAWTCRPNDPGALAAAIREVLDDQAWSAACEASRSVASSLRTSGVSARIATSLRADRGFRDPGTPVDPTWSARYFLGF